MKHLQKIYPWLMVLMVMLGILLFPSTSIVSIEFSLSESYVIEGDHYNCDDDWLLSKDKDGEIINQTKAIAVFSYNEFYDYNDRFALQFQIISPDGRVSHSKKVFLEEDYGCSAYQFSFSSNGKYDIFIYVNGMKWDRVSFHYFTLQD